MNRNLPLLYIIRAIQCSFVVIPTLVLFLEDNGLTLQDVLLLKALLSVVMILTEIPSGYVADILGRKFTLLLGMFLWVLAMLIYCMSSSFVGFLFGEIVFGLGFSFISGADTAILYDTLQAQDRVQDYPRHEGRISSVMGFSEAIGGLVGASIASYHLRSPFYLALGLYVIAVCCVQLLVEPPRDKKVTHHQALSSIAAIMNNALVQDKALKWLFLHGSISGVTTFLVVWFAQKYMDQIGLPVAAFGIAWAVFHVILGLSSLYAQKLERGLGPLKTFLMLSLTMMCSLIMLGMTRHLYALVFVGLLYFTRGVRGPLIRTYINKKTESDTRATVLSIYSFLFRVEWALYAPFIGWVADMYTLSTAFILSGLMLGGLCLFTLVMMRRHGSLST